MMNRNIILIKKQKVSFYTTLLIAFLLSSCAHLTHLDRAQDAFSKGAELENAYLFNPASSSASSPKAYYDLAYAEVDKALESKGKLEKVNILGTAYSIKALSAWKRDDYNEARSLAKTAKRYLKSDSNTAGQNVNVSRDYAMMEAMDALITIETSNDSIYLMLDQGKTMTAESAKDIYKQLIHNSNSTGRIETAIIQLDSISATVSKKHEVRVYFNMSQLAGLKIWSDALGKVKSHLFKQNAFEANSDWYNSEEDLYLAKKDNYLQALAEKIPNGKKDSVYVFWKFILE
jgi:cellobiose-specific phosphotransferase system component IIA